MGTTPNYGLSTITGSVPFSTDSYKYTNRDRLTIDRLLALGAEGHHHDGEDAASEDPVDPAGLTLDSTQGALEAGTRVYYKFSLVDPTGAETAASPESYVDTPAGLTSPGAPSLLVESGAGSLLPGTYYYALSAYYPTNTEETPALNPAWIPIAAGADNAIRITFPSLPAGAAGWNLYRQKPGDVSYFFLAAIPAGPTFVTDSGAVAQDCDRRRPTVNSTNDVNAVLVRLPEPPGLPAPGWTWKVYRTLTNGNWLRSLLHHVVEETFEGSGITATTYLDLGTSTTTGQPPTTSQIIGSPSQVDLADAAEVQGRLPMGHVQAFPFVVTFAYPDVQVTSVGTFVWVCEFPRAKIIGARAALGHGSFPAAAALVVDVNKGSAGATPTLSTIYTTQSTRPRIEVGAQIGARSTPQIVDLVEGDFLSVDVDQVGGGATPMDSDLIVSVVMLAQFDNSASGFGWS